MPRYKGIGQRRKRLGKPPNYKTKINNHEIDKRKMGLETMDKKDFASVGIHQNVGAPEIRTVADEDMQTKIAAVPKIFAGKTRTCEENLNIEDSVCVDSVENKNKEHEKNLSCLHGVDAIIESPNRKDEQVCQSEEEWANTVVVKCEGTSHDTINDSQDANYRILNILHIVHRQEMNNTMNGTCSSLASLSGDNAIKMAEIGDNYINQQPTEPHSDNRNIIPQIENVVTCLNEQATEESFKLTDPDKVGPLCLTSQPSVESLSLTCQDESFGVNPVMMFSPAQYENESLNLSCQEEASANKSLFKHLNKHDVINGADEKFEAVQMYADLIQACSILPADMFTFMKNTSIVRFVQLYDKEITKIKLAVSVEHNFNVNVTVNNKLLPGDHDLWMHVPKVCLNVEHVEKLLKTLSTHHVCIGNPDEELQNVMHFLERSEEESERKMTGYRDQYIGSTIRSKNCPLLISNRFKRCENCKSYRKLLWHAVKRKNAKSETSTTNWLKSNIPNNLLSESEKIEKLKQMREHIRQLEKTISGLNREKKNIARQAQRMSNNQRNKSTMTENMDIFNSEIRPEIAERSEAESSTFSRKLTPHPVTTTMPLPPSTFSCDVTVKDEPTDKINDIIGVFKSKSGTSQPVIIKIINDKKKNAGPPFPAPKNIKTTDVTDSVKTENTTDFDNMETTHIDVDLTVEAQNLNLTESSLTMEQTEITSNNIQKKSGQACKICGKVVKFMRGHMIIHRPRRFKCPVCARSFHKKQAMELHLVVHTGVKAHKCPLCDQVFGYINTLKRHLRLHSGIRPYKCQNCPKSFGSNYNRQQHEQAVHIGVRSFACNICPKTYKTSSALSVHRSMCHEQRKLSDPIVKPSDHTAEQHTCDQCGRIYKSKMSLHSHKYLHRNNKGKSILCDLCDKKFLWPNELHRHKQKKHYGYIKQKNYMCHKCAKCFDGKGALDTHQLIHSEARPYKCSQCSASFKRRHHLQNHESTHSSVRPYQCKTCLKSFSQKYDMETHELSVHQGKRDFVCTICFKAFVRENHLRSHMKIHGGDQFH